MCNSEQMNVRAIAVNGLKLQASVVAALGAESQHLGACFLRFECGQLLSQRICSFGEKSPYHSLTLKPGPSAGTAAKMCSQGNKLRQ